MFTRQEVPPRQNSVKGEGKALLEPLLKQKSVPLQGNFLTEKQKGTEAVRWKCGAGHGFVEVAGRGSRGVRFLTGDL